MRSHQLTSLDDLQALKSGYERADKALVAALNKGNLQATQSALRAGASPVMAADAQGTSAFLLAASQPNAEELFSELMNTLGGVEDVVLSEDQRTLDIRLPWDQRLVLTATTEEQALALPKLCRFLDSTVVWLANFPPRENEPTLFQRLRDVNHRLAEGVSQGDLSKVELALAEGATSKASDVDGKPVLVWASEQPNHAQLMGTLLANDPSVKLTEEGIQNFSGSRTNRGGTAAFVPADDVTPVGRGHAIRVHSSLINSTLRAHFHTKDVLETAMREFLHESRLRGLDPALKWPNSLDFQRLLQEHYDASLAAVSAEPRA